MANQADGLGRSAALSQQYYQNNQFNATNGLAAVGWHIGGLLSDTGYDLAKTGRGLYRLATDAQTQINTVNSVGYGLTYPGGMLDNTINGMKNFAGKPLVEQADSAFKFMVYGAVTAGSGKLLGVAGEALQNSQFIMRPVNYAQVNSLSIQTLTGSFERITTVTPEMSKAFQGMEYLDPLTNTFEAAPFGKTMAVDHIFPSSEIAQLRGFNTLTREQMTNILQDKLEFGNLQPLPKTFNSSKGSSLSWDTYKGQSLDSGYVDNLMTKQVDIRIQIQKQISEYQKFNRSGVK